MTDRRMEGEGMQAGVSGDRFEVVEGYAPGVIGAIAMLHGVYYAREWGFGSFFESRVASDLCEFVERYRPGRDGLWTVWVDGRIEAAIAIDGIHAHEEGAHLRWFIVSDALRGTGVGGRLFTMALEFCRERGYARVYLETFAGLDAARHLYDRAGFRLVEERSGSQWGTEVLEQRFECVLGTPDYDEGVRS